MFQELLNHEYGRSKSSHGNLCWAEQTLFQAVILSTFILGILSLYWAALFRVEQNLSALVVYVVDFDGQVAPYTDTTPIVGPMIVEAAESLNFLALPINNLAYIRRILIKSGSKNRAKLGGSIYKFFI
jgi:hypothetical protein